MTHLHPRDLTETESRFADGHERLFQQHRSQAERLMASTTSPLHPRRADVERTCPVGRFAPRTDIGRSDIREAGWPGRPRLCAITAPPSAPSPTPRADAS